MPWLELSLTLRAEQQAEVERALEELGALCLTLQDARADTPDERAIFEPGLGETPLWNELVLDALFDADIDRSGLVHALVGAQSTRIGLVLPLVEHVPTRAADRLRFRKGADRYCTRVGLDRYQPL